MSTAEKAQTSQTEELEVLKFLKARGYELKGYEKEDKTKIWSIFSNGTYVGNLVYNPNSRFCNTGHIAVNYTAQIQTDDNGETHISLNPDQLTATHEFEKFLRQEKRDYSRGRPTWPIGEIVKFFKKDGLLKRLEEISKDLEQNLPPRL